MKPCFKCGETKPLDEFYCHAMMADGHLNKCKVCARADAARDLARRRSTPEGARAERARGRDKYWRLYRGVKRDRNPRIARGWVERHPEKRAAQIAVGNALRSGKLQRQPCEVCGDPRVDGHHPDYAKPLEVRWLCRTHHMELHRVDAVA